MLSTVESFSSPQLTLRVLPTEAELDFQQQNCKVINLCCCMLPSWWLLVATAVGKKIIGMESFFFFWGKEEEWFRKEGVFELGFEGWVGV